MAALWKCPVLGTEDKFQTQTTFTAATGLFSSHPQRVKKPNKSIPPPRTGCSASLIITGGRPMKMTKKNQIPPVRMAILMSTNNKCKSEFGVRGKLLLVSGNVHWQQTQ